MINCPKCGAENKPAAQMCRMCSTPLGAPGLGGAMGGGLMGNPNDLPPTVVFQDDASNNAAGASGIACPVCQTMNEAGWAFCQQCGTKLQKEPMIPLGQPTVADPMMARDWGMPPSKATVPDQQFDPSLLGLPTNPQPAMQPPPAAPPASPAGFGQSTVSEQASQGRPAPPAAPSPAPPQNPPPAYQATQPPAYAPPQPPYGYGAPQRPEPAPPAPRPEATAGCPRCGHQNQAGAMYCSACGSPLAAPPPVMQPPQPQPPQHQATQPPQQQAPQPQAPPAPPTPQTVVMSSVAAPQASRGRLHLIMEGGQQGEVYDLKDETMIGRAGGDITFPHDGFMSGRHARIVRQGNTFILQDEGSRNGTFVRIKGEIELQPGDMILIGKQLFRFEV